MKIGIIIQARMGSTRLPAKVMKLICGKTVMAHVIERVSQSELIDEIIVATTEHERDSVIVAEAQRCGVASFRGSEEDVLARYYHAAKKHRLDVVVRVTSDCPLIDPQVLDRVIKAFLSGKYCIASNAGSDPSNRTYPRGLDTEVFSFDALENAFEKATEKYQREHVTPFIYENAQSVSFYKNDVDYSKYRWTLDTDDDLRLITEVYSHLYHGHHDFYLNDIVNLFEEMPHLFGINSHIEQKKIK